MEKSSSKLKKTVILALAIVVLAALGGQLLVGGIISRPTQDIKLQSKSHEEMGRLLHDLAVLQKAIQINVIQVQQYLQDVSATRGLDGLDDGFDNAEEHAKAFDTNMAAAEQLATKLNASETLSALGEAKSAFPAYYATGKKMAQAYVAIGPEGGNAMMSEFDEAATKIQEAVGKTQASIDKVLTQIDADGAEARASVDRTMQMALVVAGMVILVTTALGIAVAAMIMRKLLNPLVATTAALNGLAAGRRDIQIKGADRKDEMGDLARAFARFKEQADERVAGEDAAARRAEMEKERERNAALQAAALHAQQAISTEIGQGLSNLANGDLTYRITHDFPAGYEQLKDDFNSAMVSLEAAIATIAASGQAIRVDTSDVSRAAQDLSMRAEQQAASLEETAAAIGHITGNIRRTAEGAGTARKLTDEAKTRAEQSGVVVEEAISAMAGIESASRQISGIIGVIDEIAFQTNLLALNAGVEAARAGESGRGFAVVALEVRNLAQRSASAAKEIKTLISATTDQVSRGVDLVSRSGEALKSIMGQVGDLAVIVRSISTATDEQATGISEVNIAIGQMDQMTQQNAAIAEESTAASVGLFDKADVLAQQIGRFRIDAGATSSRTVSKAMRRAA
jgi:methyl-accepting chemotaxis protein